MSPDSKFITSRLKLIATGIGFSVVALLTVVDKLMVSVSTVNTLLAASIAMLLPLTDADRPLVGLT